MTGLQDESCQAIPERSIHISIPRAAHQGGRTIGKQYGVVVFEKGKVVQLHSSAVFLTLKVSICLLFQFLRNG